MLGKSDCLPTGMSWQMLQFIAGLMEPQASGLAGTQFAPLLYQQETFMLKAKTATCWFVSQLSLFLQGSEHSGSLLLCCRLRCDDLVVFTHFFAAMISTSTLAKLN